MEWRRARHVFYHVCRGARGAYELKVSGNRRYSKERKERKLIGQSTSCPRVSGEDDDEEYLQARMIIFIVRGRRGVRNV